MNVSSSLKVKRARNLDAAKTLAMATWQDKKRERPALTHIHTDGPQRVAVDGFRLHYAPGEPTESCAYCEKNEVTFPDYNQIIPRDGFNAVVHLDADALRLAVVRAAIFAREGNGAVQLTVQAATPAPRWTDNQDAPAFVNVTGTSEEVGSSTTTVPADVDYLANDFGFLAIAFRWNYLRDALDHCAPQGGTVTLKITRWNAPMLMTGPVEETGAVIMPMDVRDLEPQTEPIQEPAAVPYKELARPVRVPQDREPSPVGSHDYDTESQTNPPEHYTATPRLTCDPAPDAVSHDLAIVGTEFHQRDVARDVKRPRILVKLAMVNPQPIEEEPAPQAPPSTKSERMTAHNLERARIRREVHPAFQAEALRALYAAFGNAQRKTPQPLESIEVEGLPASHALEYARLYMQRIEEHRAAHNVTQDLESVNNHAQLVTNGS